jgi:hypothetical protein
MMKTLARQGDKAEVLHRLQGVHAGSVARWGRMSAHQMVCHCSDAFSMALGETRVVPVGGLAQRTLVKWFALYLPMPWPSGITTSPELDQVRGGGTCPSDFAADVARLVGLVERVAARARGSEWQRHPVFGPLSDAAWLRWGYLHMDHHLRQFGA